ncbi:hypothetical protein CS022_04475 [Veronia nyctiphanis]|uniref:Uncharacterized protein n=1 Tax=Veronia nyctiphanis TaxID=1278244 RepID=A0A4Q0YYX7_9GAMM|nr:hypothetical protein CS022_04475 [Veronia nyctiphanis]
MVLASGFISTPSIADNSDEIFSLRQELQLLRSDILRLESKVHELEKQMKNRDKAGHKNSNKWGCYLDDLSAGGVYGTGRTEMEAKGKTLATCKEKGGTCFEMNLKCSADQ